MSDPIIHNVVRALEAYRERSYPQTEEALARGELKMDVSVLEGNEKVEVVLDDKCCILEVSFKKRGAYKVEVSLEELMFSKPKASCPRSGKQYLAVVNELNTHVFSKRETYGVERVEVIFKVKDSATIPGLPTMHVAGPTVRRTKWIADGGLFRSTEEQINLHLRYKAKRAERGERLSDDDRPERDRSESSPRQSSLRLRDVVIMDELRARQPLFFEHVLKHTHATIYDGSILIADFAKFVLRQEPFRISFKFYLKKLILRIWYMYIVTNEESCSDSTPVEDDDDAFSITEVHMVLSILTLLQRNDCKTWYMAELDLQICSDEVADMDPCDQIREFQTKQVGSLDLGEEGADFDFREHVHSNVKEAISMIVDHSRRTADRLFSFYDAYVYLIIEIAFYKEFDSIIDLFTEKVCRKLYSAR